MSLEVAIPSMMRDAVSKSGVKLLRNSGYVPCSLYGGGSSAISLALSAKELTKVYHSGRSTTTIITLEFNDRDPIKALIRSVQLHPVQDAIIHADLMPLAHSGHQIVAVPIIYENREKSLGVKRGGRFNIIKRKLNLLCDVSRGIPSELKVDTLELPIGSRVFAGDIALPEGAELAVCKKTPCASIIGKAGKADKSEEQSAK